MIDTIVLSSMYFTISNETPLEYKKTHSSNSDLHLITETNEIKKGEKAFYNSKNRLFQIEIKDCRMFIKFSFSKIHTYLSEGLPLNLKSVTHIDNRNCLDYMKQQLKDLKITIHWNTLTITQIHLFKNFNLSKNIKSYYPIIQNINIRSALPNKTNYKTSITKGNKSFEIILYDKSQELKDKYQFIITKFSSHKLIKKHISNKNTIRLEIKYKNTKKLEQSLSKYHLENNLDILVNKTKFSILVRELYQNSLISIIGNSKPVNENIDIENLVSLLTSELNQSDILKTLGVQYILHELKDIESYIKLLNFPDRQTKSRHKTILSKYSQKLSSIKKHKYEEKSELLKKIQGELL